MPKPPRKRAAELRRSGNSTQGEVRTPLTFSWRRLYRDGLLGPTGSALVPVAVKGAPSVVVDASPPRVTDTIEIEVPGGYRVRVGTGVDGEVLRRVLDALARR
jgi:transposase